MNQKLALTLTAAITAFVLVVGGGVAGRLAHPAAASASTPVAADIQTLYAQREAAYQAQIDAANMALADAYAAQNNASVATTLQPTATPSVALTPEEAMSAAIITVPGATILSIPELVNYQGIVAYEVKLNLGVMYIDASNGAVLYNGTVQPQSVLAAGANNDSHEDGDD
jgi:uncharacterized membrane protein YkoI